MASSTLRVSMVAVVAFSGAILTSSGALAGGTPPCVAGAVSDSTECGAGSSTGNAGATAIGDSSSAGNGGSSDGDTAVGFFATAVGLGSDAALAIGSFASANGGGATAVGNDVSAVGAGATAFGGDDPVQGATTANGVAATAVGAGADATADNATALGNHAVASGISSTALGQGSTAAFTNSTAVGAGAATTRIDQVMLGTSSNTYTMSGINSAASTAAQTGTVRFMTADGAGNLATSSYGPDDIASLDGRVTALESSFAGDLDKAYEGSAIAMAMAGGGALPSDKNFAVSINWGTYAGQHGFAGTAAARINEHVSINGGLGVGSDSGEVGARAGLTFAW